MAVYAWWDKLELRPDGNVIDRSLREILNGDQEAWASSRTAEAYWSIFAVSQRSLAKCSTTRSQSTTFEIRAM